MRLCSKEWKELEDFIFTSDENDGLKTLAIEAISSCYEEDLDSAILLLKKISQSKKTTPLMMEGLITSVYCNKFLRKSGKILDLLGTLANSNSETSQIFFEALEFLANDLCNIDFSNGQFPCRKCHGA